MVAIMSNDTPTQAITNHICDLYTLKSGAAINEHMSPMINNTVIANLNM